jgi:predicted DNA-binding transcriptional regulator AlpA
MNIDVCVYRPAQLAKKLGVSTCTLWRWRRDGYLPEPSKLGPKLVFWDVKVIDEWIQNNS